MPRRTKIVATLGPATDDPNILEDLIVAGLDVARLNFSHGNAEDHIKRVKLVREIAERHHREVGILADLQGPKIRIGNFSNKEIILNDGDTFTLDAGCALNAGTKERVGLTYKELVRDVKAGDVLLLDDGRVRLKANKIKGKEVICDVIIGGILSNGKGINREGGGLSAAALTEKDHKDIETAAKLGVDYLAISFPRSAADVEEARTLLRRAGGKGAIIAKIERAEAINEIEKIITAADAVMIARGDLGVEMGDAAVPPIQKQIIKQARRMNKVTITATQMMESMIYSAVPTRAEVSDVANAVLDGTDAVMLSSETAQGKHPVEALQAMDRVCRETERHDKVDQSQRRAEEPWDRVDKGIAWAVMYTANHLPVRAIAALTESGSTPLWMSRISSEVPIYALTPHAATRRKMALIRGVYPVHFATNSDNPIEVIRDAIDTLHKMNAVKKDNLVILTIGEHLSESGGTNTMKVIKVGEPIRER